MRTSPSPTQTPMAPAFEAVGCPDGRSHRSPPESTLKSCMSQKKSASVHQTRREKHEGRNAKRAEKEKEKEIGRVHVEGADLTEDEERSRRKRGAQKDDFVLGGLVGHQAGHCDGEGDQVRRRRGQRAEGRPGRDLDEDTEEEVGSRGKVLVDAAFASCRRDGLGRK